MKDDEAILAIDFTTKGEWVQMTSFKCENIQDDNRTIVWVYDPLGGAGKTAMGGFLEKHFGASFSQKKTEKIPKKDPPINLSSDCEVRIHMRTMGVGEVVMKYFPHDPMQK